MEQGTNVPTSRRGFLSAAGKTAAGAVAAVSAPAILGGRTADAPPNVLFIVCDQMRGDALSFLGPGNARTPNLDRMARGGVAFENCFSNNPVCVPSRKSWFSGRYPHQHGSLTNRGKPLLFWAGSLAEHFAGRGYRTGYVGKNHTYEKSALEKFATAHIRSREPFRAYSGFVPPWWHGDVYWPEEDCHPRINTDEALRFLDERGREPFFLHVSYFDPHPPYMAPARFTSRYTSAGMELPPYVPPDALSRRLADHARAMGFDRMTKADLTETMRYYYAQIEWIDSEVGRLLDGLRRRNLLEGTVVIFSSDHGDFMGHHRMVRKGMFLYDDLLHVPMIWYAPGRIAAGHRSEALAQGIDVFPTLVDLTGGKRPEGLMGRSLRPFLTGEPDADPNHAIFTSAAYGELSAESLHPSLAPTDGKAKPLHTRVLDQNISPGFKTSMIRTREWKFILNESRPPELYKLDGGCGERENVAGKSEYAGVRRQLERKLQQWWPW